MHIQFSSLHDFILMGRHGVYVWSAWLVSFFTLLLLIRHTIRGREKLIAAESMQQRIAQARKQMQQEDHDDETKQTA